MFSMNTSNNTIFALPIQTITTAVISIFPQNVNIATSDIVVAFVVSSINGERDFMFARLAYTLLALT